MTSLLEVDSLRVSFRTDHGAVRAVEDLSFQVSAGETLGIVGESGSGKSASLRAMLRLDANADVSGEVRLRGTDVLTLSDKQMLRIRGGEIAMIFQDPLASLHPHYTVGYQIAEAISAHENTSRRVRRQRTLELLSSVGFAQPTRSIDDYPHQLSGGMRQRVMIAMALAGRPAVLVADEPTTALDATIQAQVMQLLVDVQREHGTALILVSHDLSLVAEVADRVAVMYAGKVVETAGPQEIFADPRHPYTRGLVRSIPSAKTRTTRLVSIPGEPPQFAGRHGGCAFRPRCELSRDQCGSTPELRSIGDGRSVACWVSLPDSASQLLDAQSPGPTQTLEWRPTAATPERTNVAPVLSVRGLVKTFSHKGMRNSGGAVAAVDGVDLDVRPGETVGLVGESGSGKSTLARCLLRLIEPTGGTILFEGSDMANLKRRELRATRRRIQMVFQDPYSSLNPRRRIGSIIADPLAAHGIGTRRDREQRARELMEMVGLDPEWADRYPAQFSGGQRQRIAIARALAARPSLIVCDEPVSALDVSVQAQVLTLLERIQRELGVAYLFISHDIGVVQHMCDRVYVMYRGKIIEVSMDGTFGSDPQHPYTLALLNSVPRPRAEEMPRQRTRTDLPVVAPTPDGCRFLGRCTRSSSQCAAQEPQLRRLSNAGSGAYVACHHPGTKDAPA